MWLSPVDSSWKACLSGPVHHHHRQSPRHIGRQPRDIVLSSLPTPTPAVLNKRRLLPTITTTTTSLHRRQQSVVGPTLTTSTSSQSNQLLWSLLVSAVAWLMWVEVDCKMTERQMTTDPRTWAMSPPVGCHHLHPPSAAIWNKLIKQ